LPWPALAGRSAPAAVPDLHARHQALSVLLLHDANLEVRHLHRRSGGEVLARVPRAGQPDIDQLPLRPPEGEELRRELSDPLRGAVLSGLLPVRVAEGSLRLDTKQEEGDERAGLVDLEVLDHGSCAPES